MSLAWKTRMRAAAKKRRDVSLGRLPPTVLGEVMCGTIRAAPVRAGTCRRGCLQSPDESLTWCL